MTGWRWDCGPSHRHTAPHHQTDQKGQNRPGPWVLSVTWPGNQTTDPVSVAKPTVPAEKYVFTVCQESDEAAAVTVWFFLIQQKTPYFILIFFFLLTQDSGTRSGSSTDVTVAQLQSYDEWQCVGLQALNSHFLCDSVETLVCSHLRFLYSVFFWFWFFV